MRLSAVRGGLLALALGLGFGGSQAVAQNVSPVAKGKEALTTSVQRGTPIGFVENKGQFGPEARFFVPMKGVNVWVTDRGVKYDFYRRTQDAVWSGGPKPFMRSGPKFSGHVVELEFLGARQNPTPQGVRPGEGTLNYLYGANRFAGVQHYEEARVNSIYDGVDLRVYEDQGAPRFDVIVAPGTDPNVVRFRYAGAGASAVKDSDTLTFQTRFGTKQVTDLFAYQNIDGQQVPVTVAFVNKGNGQFGFSVGDYDRSKPLVIDPVVYSTLVGSFDSNGGQDGMRAVAVDRFGAPYLTGFSSSLAYPVTNGSYDNIVAGTDVVVTKMRNDATGLIYSTYIGGTGTEAGFSIAVDSQGRAVIGGFTTSTSDPLTLPYPTTPGAIQETYGGQANDGFLTRLSADGSRLDYSTYLGGNNAPFTNDVVWSVDVDQNDNMYAGGETGSADFPVSGGALQVDLIAGVEGFALKVNGNGSLGYSTYMGGSAGDQVFGVAVNNLGELHLTGATSSANFRLTAGAVDTTMGLQEAYVSKLNAAGTNVLYSTFIGGSSDDTAVDIDIDVSGTAYIVGSTSSVDFPRTPGCFDDTYNPDFENFITKLAIDGRSFIYSTFLNSGYTPQRIRVDDLGVAYVAGFGNFISGAQLTDDASYNGPNPPFAFGDAILQAIDEAGANMIYSSFFGGEDEDGAFGLAVDRSRNAYIAGQTRSFTGPNRVAFPTTPGVFRPTMALDNLAPPANYDGFLVKAKVRNTPLIANFAINPGSIAGTESTTGTITLSVPATPGGAVIRLSSTLESVARPVDASGNLIDAITIPEGQTVGTFNISSSDVVGANTVGIIAELEGDTKRANVTVAPWLTNMTLSPNTVVGGNRVTGRVTLFRPATSGLTVQISSSDTARAYAVDANGNRISTFVVPAGQTTATFDILTRGVDLEVPVTLLAKIVEPNLQVTRSQVLRIRPAALRSVTFEPTRVNGGEQAQATVTLDGEVGPTPALINLSLGRTGSPAVNLVLPNPPTVTIRRNATNVEIGKSVRFMVTAGVAASNSFREMVASRQGANPAQIRTGTLFIDANDISSISLLERSVVGGTVVDGSVTLRNPAAASGFNLKVRTSDPVYAPLNGTREEIDLNIPAGAIRADFRVNTKVTTVAKNVTFTTKKDGYADRTTTLAIRAIDYTFTIDPPVIVGGSGNPTATIRLNEPAPSIGLRLTLVNGDPSAITIPAAITFNSGQTVATFPVTTKSVVSSRVAIITATLPALPSDLIKTASLTVNPLLVGLSINPTTVVGGNTSVGTVTITAPAGPGGVRITLSSNSTNAVVPTQVTVPAGGTTQTFTIQTKEVLADTRATITARTPAGAQSQADLSITALGLSVSVDPNVITGGLNTSTGRVNLTSPAAKTLRVDLSVNNGAVTLSTPFTNIGAGQTTSPAFTLRSASVADDVTVTVTARLAATGRTATTSLTVRSPRVTSVRTDLTDANNVATLLGGESTNGTVAINTNAPTGGTAVGLSSSSAALQVPPSVTVAAASRSARFPITTSVVTTSTSATITATRLNSTATTLVNIRSLGVVVELQPSTLAGGASSTGRVRLSAAQSRTLTFGLTSSNTAVARLSRESVTLAPGEVASITFGIATSAVVTDTQVTITARAQTGHTGANTLTVTTPRVLNLVLATDQVVGGDSTTGRLDLTSVAPSAGAVVNLSSSDPSTTVPATLTVPGGSSSANFTVRTAVVPSDRLVTITASRAGSTATDTLTVLAPSLVALELRPASVTGGAGSTGIVSLDRPAPAGGITIQLAKSALSTGSQYVTIPSSVTIPAGSRSASFAITTAPVSRTVSSLLTATFAQRTQEANAILTLTPR